MDTKFVGLIPLVMNSLAANTVGPTVFRLDQIEISSRCAKLRATHEWLLPLRQSELSMVTT